MWIINKSQIIQNLYICFLLYNQTDRRLRYSKTTLDKLEQLFKEQLYTVRYEKGNFNSGYCLVEQKKMAVVNKFYDIEGRINILLDILFTISIDEALFSDKTLHVYKQIAKDQEANLNELVEM